ncbi:Uncharacterised protein [Chlamydia trachomatis]|nr:Uncharacterised protein [Chlamydia trachomatis]
MNIINSHSLFPISFLIQKLIYYTLKRKRFLIYHKKNQVFNQKIKDLIFILRIVQVVYFHNESPRNLGFFYH